MGCCCSNNDDSGYSDPDASDENTRLLGNNHTINIPPGSVTLVSNRVSPGGSHTDGVSNGYGFNQQDPQSALISILTHTASEFIVCNAEPENVEYQELKSRSAQYREKLSTCLGGSTTLPPLPYTSLPAGVPSPHIYLHGGPMPSRTDVDMVCTVAQGVMEAVHGMRATGKEKLVVNLDL